MSPADLSDDAKVILLLCGHFGKEASPSQDAAPLGTAEYGRFSAFLQDRGLRPASLFDEGTLAGMEGAMCPVPMSRVRSLLGRGAAMSFAVEGWMSKGLWVLCRSDAGYPRRLKRYLRDMAPPVIWGAGPSALLEDGGLAIVGSRDLGERQQSFASQIANRCALEGLQVVSGGARGVDQVAMEEALAAGGTVAGALADSLLRTSLKKASRKALSQHRLVLISTVHPEAGFSVGSAMARNKLIYALADSALVVQTDHGKGGTWTGAVEALGHTPARPVFIHPGFSAAAAERELMEKGALPFPELSGSTRLKEVLKGRAVDAVAEESVQPELSTATPPGEETEEKQNPDESTAPPPSQPPEPTLSPATLFDAVWPVLLRHLSNPIEPAALAEAVDARKPQMDDWLKLALEKGLVQKFSKPVRYAASERTLFDLK